MPIDRTEAQCAPLQTSLLQDFVRLVMESHCISPRQIEDLARAFQIRPQDVAPARVARRPGRGRLARRAGRSGARRPARRFGFPLFSAY
jgi:hypothetical protein